VHFSASIFLATYLHKFSALLQLMYFFGAVWDKFPLSLVLIVQQNLKD
jgi:hypothetical protein